MITVDLITGFLGAGKTTFIKKYIQYLQKEGHQIRIIENEFGESNIDTHFLEDEHLKINDLAGKCMCCVGKTAFIQMLEEAAKSDCDRIIVEPSGIYDVDEFFETLSLPSLQQVVEIGTIITIIDPYSLDYLSKESKYLMFAQLLASGSVIMSKTQYLTSEQIHIVKDKINSIMEEFGCTGGLLADLSTKSWDQLTSEDFHYFEESFYNRYVHDRYLFNHMEVFQSLEIKHIFKNQEHLHSVLHQIFHKKECGLIYRIKGYTSDISGNIYEVNTTQQTMNVQIVDKQIKLELIIIGEHIHYKPILACLKGEHL